LSVRGVGRRTQPIGKLLNDLLITSAFNPTCLLQSALNPTCLLQVSDFHTHLYLDSANSGDVDIRNLTVTLIRTVVLQRSWYQMPGCSVQ
jgi:hypothetical protein